MMIITLQEFQRPTFSHWSREELAGSV